MKEFKILTHAGWMQGITPFAVLLIVLLGQTPCRADVAEAKTASLRPNVIIILADDMGYGDPRCFNSETKIQTPHIDQLAREGMRFTNAHSPSAICVPTRYGLLTGRYPVRMWTEKGRRKKVYKGWESPHYGLPTIARDRREGKETLNLAQLFRQNGYATTILGKWHQGQLRKTEADGTFAVTPIHFGFDYFFGFESLGGPRAWIENDCYVEAPTATIDVTFESYVPDDPSKTDRFSGAAAPSWDFYAVLPTLADKADAWLTKHVAVKKARPFFLYYALPAPHTPWTPGPNERGKSGAGRYGDYVMSVDVNIGKLLAAVKRLGLENDTLVFFSSDNGPAWRHAQVERFQHRAAGPWNGWKGSILKGGHRMPFIARWPAQVRAGTTCDQLICFTDFLATMAAMLKVSLPDDAGPDSFSFLPLLRGETLAKPIRSSQIHDQYGSYRVGYTYGYWKLILPQRTYFVHDRKMIPDHIVATTDKRNQFQLYNLRTDPSETTNLAVENPDQLQAVFAALKADIERGRSRPVN